MTNATPMTTKKPRRKAAAAAKRAPKPRAPKAPTPKGIHFQSRGRHKCVKIDSQACTGAIPWLQQRLYPWWNYDKAEAAGTLLARSNPKPREFFEASGQARNQRRRQYGRAEGVRFDAQVDRITRFATMRFLRTQASLVANQADNSGGIGVGGVPLMAFVDARVRHDFVERHMRPQGIRHVDPALPPLERQALEERNQTHRERNRKQVARLESLARNLMPEADTLCRYLAFRRWRPVATQTAVADAARRIGTKIDLEVEDTATGMRRVVENKLGCQRDYGVAGGQRGEGRHMEAPAADIVFGTHNAHLLQLALNQHCYRATFPETKLAAPVLVRIDNSGLHAYACDAWVHDRLRRLL